jgi:hypothetical protein
MTKQDTTRDISSHGAGTRKGESRKGESRAQPIKQRPTRKANDASGINPEQRGPISPKMPHLPPA